MDETMGARIRMLRVAKGYTQEALGRRIGDVLGRDPITKATVSKWEDGTTTYIREVNTLAEVLGVDVAYLRWGADRAPKAPGARSAPISKKRRPDGGSAV